MHTSTLHPNVRKLRAYAMLSELSFMIPVIIMFAQWRGVTFAQFMAIQAMFSVVMILATPLVSPLADKYGRRPAIIAGSVLWTLGHTVILLGYGWQTYALAEVFLGLAVAAFRPAKEALLYESLASVGRTDAHYTALTQQNRALSYAGAVAMALGGWLYTLHPTVPVAATVLANAVMVGLALTLQEAPYVKSIADEVPTYRRIVISAWQSLASPQTRWLVILPGLITGSTITLFWSVQPTLTAAGVGATVASILLAAYFTLRGWFAGWCPWLIKRFTGKQCFAMAIVAVFMGFTSLALLPWWAAYPLFAIGSGCSYMLADTMGRELVHRHVASAVRSTALGGFQFASRVIGVTTLSSCAALQPWLGLPGALLVIAGIALVLSLASLTRLPKETSVPTALPEKQTA